MIRYEVLFLAVPEITNDETASFEGQLEKLVKEHKGNMISFERWGKYRLAYPIRDNDYGVYFLSRFEAASENLKGLLDALKDFFQVRHNELVMRHMIARLKDGISLTYQRPESLEEVPTRSGDFFNKDNRGRGNEADSFEHAGHDELDGEEE